MVAKMKTKALEPSTTDLRATVDALQKRTRIAERLAEVGEEDTVFERRRH